MAGPTVVAPMQSDTSSVTSGGGGSSNFQLPVRHQFTHRPEGHHVAGPSTFHRPRHHKFQPRFPPSGGGDDAMGMSYDGKRMRKAIHRKTVDYNPSVFKYLQNRVWQRDRRDEHFIQPDSLYTPDLLPPSAFVEKPMNCVTTRFVRTSTNKFRCPIFSLSWTPEGRRLVTGASSGEFTLWNGLTFNFETILQAHETAVRAMRWSHSDAWMVTADHAGYIKYWQSNMNNVKMYQGHKEPIRGISFCPFDSKFASCSDDGTVRVWDFMRCHEERILRGHGADVRCVDWHPQKGLIASGSKDNQQPIKLWDPRSGTSIATIHAHKHTVMDLKWHPNGNWMLTASRDHLVKLFDLRNMKEEKQTFKGHKREATVISWHPIHESLFASGSADGALMFWMVGCDHEVGSMEEAHEGMVWDLSWHPLGHILASGSNDHTTKFWTRNRPGDEMRDKYNLNNLPQGMMETEILEYHSEPLAMPTLPGMGLEHGLPEHLLKEEDLKNENELPAIPGLDWEADEAYLKAEERASQKKVPYARPVPKVFEQAWSGEIDIEAMKKEQQEKQMKQQQHQQKMQANFLRPNQPALLLAQQVLGAAIAGTLRQSMSISEAARMLIPGAPVLMRPNAPRIILAPGQSTVGQPQNRMLLMPGMPRGLGTPNQQMPNMGNPAVSQESDTSAENSQPNNKNGPGSSVESNTTPSQGISSQSQKQQGTMQNPGAPPFMLGQMNTVHSDGGPGIPQNMSRFVRPQGQGPMGGTSASHEQSGPRFQGRMPNPNVPGGFQGQMIPSQGQMGVPPPGHPFHPGGPPITNTAPQENQVSGPHGSMGSHPGGPPRGPPPPPGQFGMSQGPMGQMANNQGNQNPGLPPQPQPQGQMGVNQNQFAEPPHGQFGGPQDYRQSQFSQPPSVGNPHDASAPRSHGYSQGKQGQAPGHGYGTEQDYDKDERMQSQRNVPPVRMPPPPPLPAGSQGDQPAGEADQDYRAHTSYRGAPLPPPSSSEQDSHSKAMGDYDYRQPPGRNRNEVPRPGPGRPPAPRFEDQGGSRNHDKTQGGFRGHQQEGGDGAGSGSGGGGGGGDEYGEEWGNGDGDYDYRYSGRGRGRRGEEHGSGNRGGGGGGGGGSWQSQSQGGYNRGEKKEEEWGEQYNKYGDDGGGGGGGYNDGAGTGGGGYNEDYGYEDQNKRGGDSTGGRGRKRAWEEGPGGTPSRGRGGRSRGGWGGGGARGGRGEARGRMGFHGPGRGSRGGGRGRGGERGRGRGGY